MRKKKEHSKGALAWQAGAKLQLGFGGWTRLSWIFFAQKKPTPALRKGRHIKTKRKTNFLSWKAI